MRVVDTCNLLIYSRRYRAVFINGVLFMEQKTVSQEGCHMLLIKTVTLQMLGWHYRSTDDLKTTFMSQLQ